MGMLKTIPDEKPADSGVANMTILGYAPENDYTGRGPFEALSAGVKLRENDIVFRVNLINIENDLISDYSSGHITTEQSKPLIDALRRETRADFSAGVQYRHILKLDGNKYSQDVRLTPPHDILGQPYKQYLAEPKDKSDIKAKSTADFVNKLIDRSYEILKNHKINKKREKERTVVATHIWPWGAGKKPNIKTFKEKYGIEGSVISAVDLIFGIGIAAGLEPIRVEGATGLPDTNYRGKVEAALKQLREKDFVYLHIEAIDEMGHTGDPKKKIAALEDFDLKIVKPFIEAEEEFNNELIIVVLPDHPTPCKKRTHTRDPVPFVIYNPKKVSKSQREYSENTCKEGEYGLIESGEEFMKLILSN